MAYPPSLRTREVRVGPLLDSAGTPLNMRGAQITVEISFAFGPAGLFRKPISAPIVNGLGSIRLPITSQSGMTDGLGRIVKDFTYTWSFPQSGPTTDDVEDIVFSVPDGLTPLQLVPDVSRLRSAGTIDLTPESLQQARSAAADAATAARGAAASAAAALADAVRAGASTSEVARLAAVAAKAAADAEAAALGVRGRVGVTGDPLGRLRDGRATVIAAYAEGDLPTGGDGGVVAWEGGISGKPATFPPTIGSGPADAVAGNDSRLTDARPPTEHGHDASAITMDGNPIDEVIRGKADTSRVEDLGAQLDDFVTRADIDADLDLKANAANAHLTGQPTADFPGATPVPGAIATTDWVVSRFAPGPDGTVVEIPQASPTSYGTIRLAGTLPGNLAGPADFPYVVGFDDKADRSELDNLLTRDLLDEALTNYVELSIEPGTGKRFVPEELLQLVNYARLQDGKVPAANLDLSAYALAEALDEYQKKTQWGFAPLNEDNVIPAAYLSLAPGGSTNPLGDMGAVRPEDFTGTTEEKLEKAIAAAHTAGKSVYVAGTYTITRVVSGKNKNARIWGPGRFLVPPSREMGTALTFFHDTVDSFAVRMVTGTSFGWEGTGKPANSDSIYTTQIVPDSQASLQKVRSEERWRLENTWAGDKYIWSSEVKGTVLKGSHIPIHGVMFRTQLVVGKLFAEGDTVVQKSSSGVAGARGVLKGFQKTAQNSSKQTTYGQLLFENLTGTFNSTDALYVKDVKIGTLIADEPTGALGTILVHGMPLEDTFTSNPATPDAPTLVLRKLPDLVFSIKGPTFETSGVDPESNLNRRDRVKMLGIGNCYAPEVDVTFKHLWTTGVLLAGTPNFDVRARCLDFPSDARLMSETMKDSSGATVPNPDYDPELDIAALGYVVERYGASDNGRAQLFGGRGRHFYTNNPYQTSIHPLTLPAASRSDFAMAAIGTARDCVTKIFAFDCWANAFDLHEGSLRDVLQDSFIAGSMAGGMKDQGRKAVGTRSFCTIIKNNVLIGSQAGIVVASVHIPGSPVFNHIVVEDNTVIGFQDAGINAGNLPAESSNHKVSVLRNRLRDAGLPKSKPWDSVGVSGCAVDMDIFDNVFERFNRAPILFNMAAAAGVKPKVRIRRNDYEYERAVNSDSNKAGGCEFWSTDGYTFQISRDHVAPKGTGTNRQPQYMYQNISGSGRYNWEKDSYLLSDGEPVPTFYSKAGSPTHGSISRSSYPTSDGSTPDPDPDPAPTDPTDPTPTPTPVGDPSIADWTGSLWFADGDSSGIQSKRPEGISDTVSGIDYYPADIWVALIGTGWTGTGPSPAPYPKGIGRATVNRHIGKSTTQDLALRHITDAPFRNIVRKWKPGVYDNVSMLSGGNDFGHFHAAGVNGELCYKDGLSALAGIYRSRGFLYTTAGGETGTWTDAPVKYGSRTRSTTVKGSTTSITFPGSGGTLILLAPIDGRGSAYSVSVDGGTPITGTTVNHGHDTALMPESGARHTIVPVHLRDLGNRTHTLKLTHTGTSGQPLIVDAFLPWYEDEADMPFVIMVPPGKSTVTRPFFPVPQGYDNYDDPKPNDATAERFRGYMAEALAPFASWKGLVVVSGADIDAAMPAGDYSVRINDGLHPNKLGHKRIANAILKTLIKYRRIPKVGTRQPTL
jgi:hypothetical protein